MIRCWTTGSPEDCRNLCTEGVHENKEPCCPWKCPVHYFWSPGIRLHAVGWSPFLQSRVSIKWAWHLEVDGNVVHLDVHYTFTSGPWLLKQGEGGSQLLISPYSPDQCYNSILREILCCCLVSRYSCFLCDVCMEAWMASKFGVKDFQCAFLVMYALKLEWLAAKGGVKSFCAWRNICPQFFGLLRGTVWLVCFNI